MPWLQHPVNMFTVHKFSIHTDVRSLMWLDYVSCILIFLYLLEFFMKIISLGYFLTFHHRCCELVGCCHFVLKILCLN